MSEWESLGVRPFARRWKTADRSGTTGWHAVLQLGRAQVGWHVYRHEGRSSDRWVFQPWLTYNGPEKP